METKAKTKAETHSSQELRPCTSQELREDVTLLMNMLWQQPPHKQHVPCPCPRSLMEDNLPRLRKGNFVVGEKTNGTRMFLMLGWNHHQGNYAVLIDRAYHIFHAPITARNDSLYQGTLVDGEWEPQTCTYTVFDVVASAGRLRKNKRFKDRYSSYRKLTEQLHGEVRIRAKAWHPLAHTAALWARMQEQNSDADGLIFQSQDAKLKPGIQDGVFKWKPSHTLDLYLHTDAQGQVQVQCGDGPRIADLQQQFHVQVDPVRSANVTLDNDVKVVECELALLEGGKVKATPILERTDKVYANDLKVVRFTVQNVKEHITIDQLSTNCS